VLDGSVVTVDFAKQCSGHMNAFNIHVFRLTGKQLSCSTVHRVSCADALRAVRHIYSFSANVSVTYNSGDRVIGYIKLSVCLSVCGCAWVCVFSPYPISY
jgi:hypothetical protein